MERILKVAVNLLSAPHLHSCLKLRGCNIIESSSLKTEKRNLMFLEDHLLLLVLQGTYTIRDGDQEFIVRKNEMILIRRSIVIHYFITGDPENNNLAKCVMFFFSDRFLKDFAAITGAPTTRNDEFVPMSVKQADRKLFAFLQSIKPYFEDRSKMDAEDIRKKLQDLLYDFALDDDDLRRQLLQLTQLNRADLSYVIEHYFTDPVTLDDLAYLSGRTLSTFKRDFEDIYRIPPAQWIREKRLEKARQLLATTSFSISDVCYKTGFENLTHFNRIFREYFEFSPSYVKKH